MARRILWSGLALAPLAAVLRFAFDVGDVPVFCVSALALVPLAWLIGEATEQAAEHTGPGIGGFLNARFGNLREQRRRHQISRAGPSASTWSLRNSLITLGIATGLTALVSEILVHSLEGFAKSAGLSRFFVSAVIVAIVGNAAEHGGAIVI